ncbi:MAG: carotenoid oxygenase family protein [Thermoanaerobaculia bacterium]|nr:carotenoid oxygenase family protein [Thermoanaerobaculia bacterium]
MTTTYPDHPQLRGNFAPLRMECDLHDVIVEGEIPADLNGTYYRNGPDPQFPPIGNHHWFGGDGMIHMFHVENGRVAYRNRWVRTIKWKLEREAGRSLFNPFNPLENDPSVGFMETDGLANTNVVWHGGKLLALEEGHPPVEINPHTLDTVGPWTFDDALEGPMTAHPKLDPETGEMLFFGYMAGGPFSPDISYQVVDRDGRLVRSESFRAPFPAMVHDFITTRDHVIFPLFPLTGSMERAMKGEPAFAWEPDQGTHIGVFPRAEGVAGLRWFETDPCFVFHPMNAYGDPTRVVAHVMQFEEAPLFPHLDGSRPDPQKANARLCEWTLELGNGSPSFKSRYLDDLTGEFPRLDERYAGLGYRHGYYAGSLSRNGGLGFDAVVHHDFERDSRREYRLDEGDATGEPIFVPRTDDAEEGEGYLITTLYRAAENRSDLAIFRAEAVEEGPMALAQLPHRVPHGFHGNWRQAR